jgi:SAM-dependent methyltransferase
LKLWGPDRVRHASPRGPVGLHERERAAGPGAERASPFADLLETAACGLCGGRRQRRLFLAKDRQYREVPEPVWCGVVRCDDCRHIYLSPRVREERIGEFYPRREYYTHRRTAETRKQAVMRDLYFRVAERYFGHPRKSRAGAAGVPEWVLAALTPIAWRLFRFRFRRLAPFIPGGRLLDFGYGSGDYLLRMRELGWECWGVEPQPADPAALEARGIRVFADLSDPRIPRDHFDRVTADHVLEHVFDPRAALSALRRLLRPGGRISIGVPNFASLSGRLFRSFWYNLSAPIHPHQFTATSLGAFLEAAGFGGIRIVRRSLAPDFLASIDLALNGLGGRLTGRKHTALRLRDSRALGVLVLPLVKAVDLAGLGDRLEAVAERTGP